MYGGKADGDLDGRHENTVTTQKWVNLYRLLLEDFKGKGHCVTMDSAYMGDIMAQIGRHVWLVNMVGTAQENCTGANTGDEKKGPQERHLRSHHVAASSQEPLLCHLVQQ